LDCGWYLGQLDLIAAEIGTRISGDADINMRLAAMNRYLFGELGYSGNIENYYDPKNSYLNEVIDRRIGLPITLSILYLEVAQRLGIAARGISFPGHFLVGVTTEAEDLIVDAFDAGAHLPRATFVERLRERAANNASVDALERALVPASKIEILLRQLRNLKSIYVEKGEVEHALNIINHMLVTEPNLMPELLERAALYESLGYARGAVGDYERALSLLPTGVEREAVVERLADAKTKAERLH
jgi:regulator of sirC expression with transglutaminase-like and TPR domain